MITLRIKEIIEARGLSPETLSNGSGVPLKDIQAYITSPTIESITDIIAEHLRKIAKQLEVPVVELVKPVTPQEVFRLKILEIAQQKNITFEELSKRCEESGVHISILAFYSTQPISNQKLNELESKNKYLSKISQILECSIEDLKIAVEAPIIKLGIAEWAAKKGLTLENLSLLTGLPLDFIDLISTQNLDNADLFVTDNKEAMPNLFKLTMALTNHISVLRVEPQVLVCHGIEIVFGQPVCRER